MKTVQIENTVHHQLRQHCAAIDKTHKEVLERYIREGIKRDNAKKAVSDGTTSN